MLEQIKEFLIGFVFFLRHPIAMTAGAFLSKEEPPVWFSIILLEAAVVTLSALHELLGGWEISIVKMLAGALVFSLAYALSCTVILWIFGYSQAPFKLIFTLSNMFTSLYIVVLYGWLPVYELVAGIRLHPELFWQKLFALDPVLLALFGSSAFICSTYQNLFWIGLKEAFKVPSGRWFLMIHLHAVTIIGLMIVAVRAA